MSCNALLQRTAGRRTLPTTASSNAQNQTQMNANSPQPSRRTLLTGALLAASTIPVQTAYGAYTPPASQLCIMQTTEEAAEACRMKVLQNDAGKQQDYGTSANARSFTTVSGVPVAEMSDAYTKETLALYESIILYGTLDPYDKARIPLIKSLKAECTNWVSQYARGGSARKQSARKFYVAVDAVSGHLASNGLAPFPRAKYNSVKNNMEEALVFLQEGR